MKHKVLLINIILLLGIVTAYHAVANSVKFDGLTGAPNEDHVATGDLTASVTTTYTAEAWIKASQLTGGNTDQQQYGYTVFASSTIVGGYPLWLAAKGSELNVWSFTNTAPVAHTTSGAGLTTGTWYHVAITSQKGVTNGTKVYVNGSLKLTYTNENQGTWNNVFTIGALRSSRTASLIPFHGLIDEVRVWNVVRTQTEIQNDMYHEIPTPLPSSLKGYWQFNETTGTNAPDLASPAHNGTLLNGASWNSPTGGAPLNPVIYVSGTFTAFNTTVGNPSASQSVAVQGTSLTSNISVSAVTGFEYSTTNAAPWTSTLSLAPTYNGNVWVRLTGGSIGAYSGNISFTSTSATQIDKAVSGEVNYIPPSTPTTIDTGVSVNITSTITGGLYYLTGTTPPSIPNPGFILGNSFSLSGTGNVTFVVTSAYPWGAYYQGGNWTSLAALGGVITFTIDFDVAKATIPIILGGGGDPTLPVELSSFTAILTADFFVKLHWVTQSETGVSGFYVYRSDDGSLDNAILISPMIDATNTTDLQEYEYTDYELYQPGTYYYWLQVQDMDGGLIYHGPTTVYFDNSSNSGIPGIPVRTGFTSVYPNPFNPRTTISYGITKAGDVSFKIYNQKGQLVKSFNEAQKAIGYWKLDWDGTDTNGRTCPTGVYFVKMHTGNRDYLTKAVLMK
jgi:hypothetical protein